MGAPAPGVGEAAAARVAEAVAEGCGMVRRDRLGGVRVQGEGEMRGDGAERRVGGGGAGGGETKRKGHEAQGDAERPVAGVGRVGFRN